MCSAAVGAAMLAVASASSASPSARLVYLRNPGAESCPDETSVRGAVAARLGYDPFFPNAAETMFIEISRDKDRYRARVKLVDAKNDVRGTREIAQAGSSCSGMIDTLALSISIAIDPDSLTRGPASPPTTEPAAAASPSPEEETPREIATPPAVPPPPDAPKDDARPRQQDARTARLELWLAPAVWFGTGPSVAFGGELGARVRWTNLSLGVSARGDLPSSHTIDGINVSFGFLGGTATACGHLGVLSACALGTLGRLTASSDAAIARDDSTLRLLLGASLGVELPASDSIRLFGRAIANDALGDQTVVVSGVNVYDLPHLSAGFELGSAIRF
jgi:hypothetical protein